MKREELERFLIKAFESNVSAIADILYDEIYNASEMTVKAGVKHKYGTYQNVRLTDSEVERLHDEYPGMVNEAIEILSEYLRRTGKVYKDHNLVLRKWVFDAVRESRQREKQNRLESERLDFNLDDIYECSFGGN